MNGGPFYCIRQKRIEHLALTDIVMGEPVSRDWTRWGDSSNQRRVDLIRSSGLQLVDVQVLVAVHESAS